jgi:hypothetical protein
MPRAVALSVRDVPRPYAMPSDLWRDRDLQRTVSTGQLQTLSELTVR